MKETTTIKKRVISTDESIRFCVGGIKRLEKRIEKLEDLKQSRHKEEYDQNGDPIGLLEDIEAVDRGIFRK